MDPVGCLMLTGCSANDSAVVPVPAVHGMMLENQMIVRLRMSGKGGDHLGDECFLVIEATVMGDLTVIENLQRLDKTLSPQRTIEPLARPGLGKPVEQLSGAAEQQCLCLNTQPEGFMVNIVRELPPVQAHQQQV